MVLRRKVVNQQVWSIYTCYKIVLLHKLEKDAYFGLKGELIYKIYA